MKQKCVCLSVSFLIHGEKSHTDIGAVKSCYSQSHWFVSLGSTALLKAVALCVSPALHFWNIIIYIPFAEVLLALWWVSTGHVSWSVHTLPVGIYIYMLAMPVANREAKAIVLLSLNWSMLNFWHLCIKGIKTQCRTDLPGLSISTIYCFFCVILEAVKEMGNRRDQWHC